MRVVGLTSVSGPYIRARWSAFATKEPENSVSLIEFGRLSETYQWLPLNLDCSYKRIVLSEQPAESQSLLKLVMLLIDSLNQVQPDIVVINGYREPATISALLWSILHKKPVILLSATKEDDSSRRGWTEAIKSSILKGCKAALVGGKPQKRYLMKLGMSGDRIFEGYNVVGNDDFHPDKIKSLPSPYQKPYFLAINRFVAKKNLFHLISCYASYYQARKDTAWDLVLCGDGELFPAIKQKIAEFGLKDVVHLPGFLQQERLLPYFAHASCLIHASTQEQWGLVVNEAMAASLPVLVSKSCGCYEDLVIEGENGFGFDPYNSQQLIDLMLKISSGEVDLAKMSRSALKHIQKFSPDYFACGLTQAIQSIKN
jgi:1,2-diacylglycerol 3-alpha-glucosyltransferase